MCLQILCVSWRKLHFNCMCKCLTVKFVFLSGIVCMTLCVFVCVCPPSTHTNCWHCWDSVMWYLLCVGPSVSNCQMYSYKPLTSFVLCSPMLLNTCRVSWTEHSMIRLRASVCCLSSELCIVEDAFSPSRKERMWKSNGILKIMHCIKNKWKIPWNMFYVSWLCELL